MPKGRVYTEAEDRAILRADWPRKAHIEDCAAVLGRSVAAVRRRGQQRLRASGSSHRAGVVVAPPRFPGRAVYRGAAGDAGARR